MKLRDQVQEAIDFLKNQGVIKADIGIVLGTGLGDLVNEIEIERSISYSDIPHFVTSTVETHDGKLVVGKLSGVKVICMHGRFHYYEGYDMRQITFPIYVLKSLGVHQLLISNAAGNINLSWKKGELMLIDDHINLLPENPLRGQNDDFFGPRFPDMSRPYDTDLALRISKIAEKEGITLRKGVYASVPGPNLETRAEYRYLKGIGADAVGMSTVPEVIVANYLGMRVCAVSVLTDDCDPDNLKPVSIQEILEIAGRAEKNLTKLFNALITS